MSYRRNTKTKLFHTLYTVDCIYEQISETLSSFDNYMCKVTVVCSIYQVTPIASNGQTKPDPRSCGWRVQYFVCVCLLTPIFCSNSFICKSKQTASLKLDNLRKSGFLQDRQACLRQCINLKQEKLTLRILYGIKLKKQKWSSISQNFKLFSAIVAKATCPCNATCAN